MNRISLKMKLLSLAVLGLGGMALAGTAAAACPTSPVPPWSAQNALFGSVAIATGGLDSSSCRLDTKITGSLGSSTAYVTDASPSNEPTYRAQFLVNLDGLSGLNLTQIVRIFAAGTDAPASGVPFPVTVAAFGNLTGSATSLTFSTACASSSSHVCSTNYTLTGSGVQRIEIAWTKGTSGSLKFWVNSNVEGTPTGSIAVDNSAWGGIDNAYLGLAVPSPGFRAAKLNKIVSFDQFDSRRTTFIGF